jgi:hypothetical protein
VFARILSLGFCAVIGLSIRGATIELPPRPADAISGRAFSRRVASLTLEAREQEILAEASRGNVPEFWRHFVEIKTTRKIDGGDVNVVYFVAPEYFAIGSDADYFLTPVSPGTAQILADRFGWSLPTRLIVDEIYRHAPVKLTPTPIPPSPAMTTVPVFQLHNDTIRTQRMEMVRDNPLGALVAGHKKDVVLTPQLAARPGKVAIYGWHHRDGQPIQPLYLGHTVAWVDYSHGARFILNKLTVNGEATTIDRVLADPKLAALLSDEGPISQPRYEIRISINAVRGGPSAKTNAIPETKFSASFSERIEQLTFEPGVRVVINSPANMDSNKPVRLVLYALPNGNSIEQTAGRKIKPDDDWHFDIQHLAAQTRWLRQNMRDADLVVAYLECAEKAWPAWRRKNDPDNKRIAEMVAALRSRFLGRRVALVLTGHSGGGSFTFGFLNGVERIPEDVERIAFLDSNYAYDNAQGHAAKLLKWLASSDRHYLCVLAYHDNIALLDGKPFVSENGGTWGRSRAMREDLSKSLPFTENLDAQFQRYTALDGRVKFLLKENPERAILHTRQVELNGFIHALLTGTELENKGYNYFGPRAYEQWIASE